MRRVIIYDSMTLPQQIAKHLRDVHFGGNWTSSNLKDQLAAVTWQQATTKVNSFNTIATLTYHVNYFVAAALQVLEGGPLDAHDKYSFDHPPINCEADWQKMLDKTGHLFFNGSNHIKRIVFQV